MITIREIRNYQAKARECETQAEIRLLAKELTEIYSINEHEAMSVIYNSSDYILSMLERMEIEEVEAIRTQESCTQYKEQAIPQQPFTVTTNIKEHSGNNYAVVTGTLITQPVESYKQHQEMFYEFMISVPKSSTEADTIKVVMSECRMTDMLTIGSRFKFTGSFISVNNYVNGKNRLSLFLAVDSYTYVDCTACDSANYIRVEGYLCKNPEYKVTPFGREITDLLVAVNRSYHKSDYLPVVTWGRTARYVSETTTVGTNVVIEGKITSRLLTSEDEGERLVYAISTSQVSIIDENSNRGNDC